MRENGIRGGSIVSHKRARTMTFGDLARGDRIEWKETAHGDLLLGDREEWEAGVELDGEVLVDPQGAENDDRLEVVVQIATLSPAGYCRKTHVLHVLRTDPVRVRKQIGDLAEFTIAGRTVRIVVREEKGGVVAALSGIDCDLVPVGDDGDARFRLARPAGEAAER